MTHEGTTPNPPVLGRELLIPGAEVRDLAIETGSASVGALVGFAIGGPIGAVLGAATPPIAMRVSRIAQRAITRRRAAAVDAIDAALRLTGTSEEQFADKLEVDDNFTDAIFALIEAALGTDPSLQGATTALMVALLNANSDTEQERVRIIADSITGLRPAHIKVLRSLDGRGGSGLASQIASDLQIPEIELRSVVLSLEAKGMIKDLGLHPIQWQLRELGKAVLKYVHDASPRQPVPE